LFWNFPNEGNVIRRNHGNIIGSFDGGTAHPRDRIFAAVEVLIGAAVVIGHNVYHKLPNEVPILVLLLWASLLIRRRPWRSVGLCRPGSWWVVVLVAVFAATLLQLKDLVTEAVAHWIWHQQEKTSSLFAGVYRHNALHAAETLGIVWTFAAFGEEFSYRALLLRRTADALNGSRGAYAVAVALSSVLFGFGHFYKGPTGVFDSTFSGLILATAYLVTRRNLWTPIFAHGLSDTFPAVATYLGWR
jgi:membrane protease YdiL (CAAX protease family)